MGPKVSKNYLITEVLQREKIYDWIFRGVFYLISKLIFFSFVSISYRDVRSTGDFFIFCKNAMNIHAPPGQTNWFVCWEFFVWK